MPWPIAVLLPAAASKGSARLLHEEDMYNIYKMAL